VIKARQMIEDRSATGPHSGGRDSAVGRARRPWIAAQHPDHGGDPDLFIAGMSRSAWLTPSENEAPITGYRRRGIAGTLRTLARRARQARRHRRGRRTARSTRVQ